MTSEDTLSQKVTRKTRRHKKIRFPFSRFLWLKYLQLPRYEKNIIKALKEHE